MGSLPWTCVRSLTPSGADGSGNARDGWDYSDAIDQTTLAVSEGYHIHFI